MNPFIFDGEYYNQIDGVAMRFPWAQELLKLFCVILSKNGFPNALQNFYLMFTKYMFMAYF